MSYKIQGRYRIAQLLKLMEAQTGTCKLYDTCESQFKQFGQSQYDNVGRGMILDPTRSKINFSLQMGQF